MHSATEVYQGRITRIHPSLDPVTRRGTIEVELEPVPDGAAPGQLCRVELTTHASRRRVIPFVALRRDEQSEYVFILDSENKAQRVNVKSGLRLAELVEITRRPGGRPAGYYQGLSGPDDPARPVKPVSTVPPADGGSDHKKRGAGSLVDPASRGCVA